MSRKSAKENTAPYGKPARASAVVATRVIYCGENLVQLKKLPDNCVDLIYIDPPFNSNRYYEIIYGESREKRAFADRHKDTGAYIDYMRPRCVELRRILKKTGSFYYHCDWHASHYVKAMLDTLFPNFQCEIIWVRTSSHSNVGKNFGVINDNILYYTQSNEYTWNQLYVPYKNKHVETKFNSVDRGGRKYTTSDLRNPGDRPNLKYSYTASNGITYQPHPNGWAVSREVMEQYDREGRLYFPKHATGRLRLKRFLDETKGERMQNVWSDIPPLNSQAAERLGYPAQKPLALLERIIKASSNENDIVLDAFCGCGTTIEAAQNLKRQWIGIDYSPTACRIMAERLIKYTTLRENEKLWKIDRGFVVRELPVSEETLRNMNFSDFENWAVLAIGGIPNKMKVGDGGIDGRIYPVSDLPKARGKAHAEFDFGDEWYPIQVKQKDKAGRPEIQNFIGVMTMRDRKKGFFVSFDFSPEAKVEVAEFFKKTGKSITLLTVKEILEEQLLTEIA